MNKRREKMRMERTAARFVSGKNLFVLGTTLLIVLNLYTFFAAYPEINTLNAGINTAGQTLAKDFSAFYIGAWRMMHNPSQVYTARTILQGEPAIYPQPEAFKYLPSFLLLVSPLLMLSYQQALIAFDVIQFLLLPFMAFLLYKLVGKKGFAVTFLVEILALLLPLPLPNWGFSARLLLAMG